MTAHVHTTFELIKELLLEVRRNRYHLKQSNEAVSTPSNIIDDDCNTGSQPEVVSSPESPQSVERQSRYGRIISPPERYQNNWLDWLFNYMHTLIRFCTIDFVICIQCNIIFCNYAWLQLNTPLVQQCNNATVHHHNTAAVNTSPTTATLYCCDNDILLLLQIVLYSN